MDVLPLTLLALSTAAVAVALVQAVRLLLRVGAPDTTLEQDAAAAQHGELAERKEMLMQLIESTRLDLETRKIGQEEHDRTMRSLKREAVAVLKEMEALGGTDSDIERAREALDATVAQLLASEEAAPRTAESPA